MSGEWPVRIGLLGPLELRVDGRQIPVRGPRRRAVLAVLASASGRTVTTDALLADAFFDVPMPQANTLHQHVSQLRALLAPHGDALERRDTGYRLDGARCSTDAAVLDQATQVARADAGQIDQLRAALASCRGDFCEDVPAPALEGRRTFYRELQLSAAELLFDLELEQGSGTPGLPERIELLVRSNPLRERLWGQLMLAQFATGRQSDALATYQRARAVLADEGGLDPGPALRELETLILRQAESMNGVSQVLPASSAPTLVWLDAAGTLQARPLLARTPVVIGRSADCDIRIDWDPMVSRRHATVCRAGRAFEVRDLGSTNGCFVNGERVETTAVLDLRGTLRIGDTMLFLRGPGQRVGGRRTTVKARHLPGQQPDQGPDQQPDQPG